MTTDTQHGTGRATTGTVVDPAACRQRLQGLLGYLISDPLNLRLLHEAMQLAVECQDVISGSQLTDHVRLFAIHDPRSLAWVSHLMLLSGDFNGAAEAGRQAMSLGIEEPAVIFNTACAYFYGSQHSQAAAILNTHAFMLSGMPAAHILHARTLHHLSQLPSAIAALQQALQQTPDSAEALGLLALLHHDDGDAESAHEAAEQALQRNPEQLDALLACASVHLEQSRIEPARELFTQATTRYPDCGRAWFGLGQLEFHELELELADLALSQATRLMPEFMDAWQILAWVHILQGDSEQASQALQHSAQLAPGCAETRASQAIIAVMQGRHEQARSGIAQALAKDPSSLAACYAEILLLQHEGKAEQALRTLNQFVESSINHERWPGAQQLLQRWLRHQQRRFAKLNEQG